MLPVLPVAAQAVDQEKGFGAPAGFGVGKGGFLQYWLLPGCLCLTGKAQAGEEAQDKKGLPDHAFTGFRVLDFGERAFQIRYMLPESSTALQMARAAATPGLRTPSCM
ncbi:hypothetical protein ADICEAN_03371 [Cesiribacter andamanensis AMV16]|uniref:Uncharacterized protein n=1 Tax=Cesiribacter andamanensis AMV16 TaxID=1279009 RepID=M7NSN9_9BACT|nr:hypothetical protein ADICEAN_03371 [Cesiribacter andamanensis AMV16]